MLRYGQGIFSGIDEPIQTQNDLLVYPNPASESFTISLPKGFDANKNVSVDIYDTTGRLLYSDQHEATNPININSKTLTKGLIFVTVTNENGERKNSRVVVN